MTEVTAEDRTQLRDLFLNMPSLSLRIRSYRKGETIIHEGMLGYEMFIILQGEVDVIVYTAEGKEVLLATLKEPEMFGEIALFDGQPRTATVVARTECELLRLTKDEFLDMIRKDTGVLFKLVRLLVKRLREADEKIKVLSMDSSVERVKWYLRKLVAETRNDEIVLPSHSEIARTLCLSREAVTRALHNLKKDAIVTNTSGAIRVMVDKI